MNSIRIAFQPLGSLETTLSQQVQSRARVLYSNAKSKTARGSGHDLDKNLAGNHTGMAAVCELLAKAELEEASADDMSAFQRHSTLSAHQFKALLSSLQRVLDLRSDAKTAFTPTRSSGRKRKAADVDQHPDDAEDMTVTTPTKSTGRAVPIKQSASQHAQARITTPRKAGRLAELASPSLSKAKTLSIDSDMAIEAASTSQAGRSSRTSAPAASVTTTSKRTTVKSKTPSTSVAFDQAMQGSSGVTRPQTQTTPSKAPAAGATSSKNTAEVLAEYAKEDAADTEDHLQIPYEPYWDDMLIRFRDKQEVLDRRAKTESWRLNLLKRLDEAFDFA